MIQGLIWGYNVSILMKKVSIYVHFDCIAIEASDVYFYAYVIPI